MIYGVLDSCLITDYVQIRFVGRTDIKLLSLIEQLTQPSTDYPIVVTRLILLTPKYNAACVRCYCCLG